MRLSSAIGLAPTPSLVPCLQLYILLRVQKMIMGQGQLTHSGGR